jgi:hypothetical protein
MRPWIDGAKRSRTNQKHNTLAAYAKSILSIRKERCARTARKILMKNSRRQNKMGEETDDCKQAKNLKISETVHKRLTDWAKKSDSFDSAINRLLDIAEKHGEE